MANTSKRGFASMDAAKQREIASKGGKAAHAKGTAHEFTSDEARVAGRKGGEAVSRDRAHMSAIGREGGHSRGARARANTGDSESNARPQSFNRQVNDERSAFGESRAASAGGAPSFGAQERGSDRGFAGSNNRGGNNQSNNKNERSERGGDTPSNNSAFSGRDEI
jgi:general stress protein YciG